MSSITKHAHWNHLVVLFFMTAIPYTLVVPHATAQDACDNALLQANENYENGLLDQAIDLLTSCFEKNGFTLEDSMSAYKLLAKAYDAKGLSQKTEQALRNLLQLNPNWQSDPDNDTPAFMAFAQKIIIKVKEEQPKLSIIGNKSSIIDRSKSKKWLWIGGGVVIAGVVAAIIIIDDEDEFPEPPGRP